MSNVLRDGQYVFLRIEIDCIIAYRIVQGTILHYEAHRETTKKVKVEKYRSFERVVPWGETSGVTYCIP